MAGIFGFDRWWQCRPARLVFRLVLMGSWKTHAVLNGRHASPFFFCLGLKLLEARLTSAHLAYISSIVDSLSLELKFSLSDKQVNTLHCIAHAALISFSEGLVGDGAPQRVPQRHFSLQVLYECVCVCVCVIRLSVKLHRHWTGQYGNFSLTEITHQGKRSRPPNVICRENEESARRLFPTSD